MNILRIWRTVAKGAAWRLQRKRHRGYDLIARSGLFDADYYLRRSEDIEAERTDPLKHYLEQGWRNGRNPNPYFHTLWYLETYPEVARSRSEPLLDYLQFGWRAGRDPSPRFETRWYLERFVDVREAGINPLRHYLQWGKAEGRGPKRPGASESPLEPYEAWLAVNQLSDRDLAELHGRLDRHQHKLPKISVITPVHETDQKLLEEAVESVTQQIFLGWELCLVNDGSTAPHVRPLLDDWAATDPRIRAKHLSSSGGTSIATNAGVEMASGDVVVFLDHDDLLSRDCLAELALYYAEHPDADIVYSDDDKIDGLGRRFAPQFKPDWSPILLLSWMYLSHVFSVRRDIFQRLGGFRSEFDGSQDYDFALRATEIARHVGHIPKVLYHWRAIEGSTATGASAKQGSADRGRSAVQQALQRRGITGARAVHPAWARDENVGMFEIEFPDEGPSVSIIISFDGRVDLLRRCLRALRATSYRNYEVLLLDDGTLPSGIVDAGNVRLALPSSMTVSTFAASSNEGVRHSSSDYLLFLSCDADSMSQQWLSQIVGYAQMSGVGAVGARLCAEDRTLLHAGKVCGLHHGLVGDAFRGLPCEDPGYLGLVRSSRECSAVGSGCLLTPRRLFNEVGGFDAANFPASFTVVDYCLRLLQAGHRSVYCAGAELRMVSPANAKAPSELGEQARYRRRHGKQVDGWYNPNLSLQSERFEVDAKRPETLSCTPIRLLVATHNLHYEGASRTLTDLVIGLKERGVADPLVLSPSDGPLRQDYEVAGIAVRIPEELASVADPHSEMRSFAEIGAMFRSSGSEVVFANTLNSFWAVQAATSVGLASVWAQHESDPWESYFDYLGPEMRPYAYAAFAQAYRVLYVAEATKRAWEPLETRRNFDVVRHAIPPRQLADESGRWSRAAARKQLGLSEDAHVLSVVGTICRRKGQIDLVKACARLPRAMQHKTWVYLAGRVAEPDYAAEIEAAVGVAVAKVVLTGSVDDPFLFYRASDIAICTSRIESAPRVIIEAMACGLPIITTPVFGIPEIVRENVNALLYEAGDAKALACMVEKLIGDPALRQELARNSPVVLESQPGFDQMVEEYRRLIRQAVNLKVSFP